MSIFSYIENLLKPKPGASGLLLDTPSSLENFPRHEIFAGGAALLSKDWTPYCPPFRYQGSSYWCTAFAGTTIGYIFEKAQNRNSPIFSPLELFYRTGGSSMGNYLSNTAEGMKKSLVLESDVPTPMPDKWGIEQFLRYREIAKASEDALRYGERFRLGSAATVRTDPFSLRAALSVSPLFLAIGIGRGYFDKVAQRQSAYSAYHAVVLPKMKSDGTFTIFDSLTQKQDFDGLHDLAPDYEIIMAMSFIDIPENWKEVQMNALETHNGALQAYGKRRILLLEQAKARNLSDILKWHPTLTGLFGRDWTICVNALSYGDYSVQDLLNHYTNIRRTGNPIFDLNRPRNAQ